MITVWNEDAADGIGGTAEIVERAQREGLIIVLVSLSGELKLWTAPKTSIDPVLDGKWEPLTIDPGDEVPSNALASRLRDLLSVPAPDEQKKEGHGEPALSPAEYIADFRRESLQPHTYFFGYDLLCKLLLAKEGFSIPVDNGLTGERKKAWQVNLASAEKIAGPSLREKIDERLRRRWIAADNIAIHCAHRFRTAFVMNFSLAFLAVLVGLLIVFWMDSLAQKCLFVAIELVIIGTILRITAVGRRNRWRDRWLDARSVAEALRPARLQILAGGSHLRAGGSPGESWVAWYVRESLREFGPPTAVIDKAALREAIDAALKDEVDGQIGYHKLNAQSRGKLDHRLELTAEVALWATIASGAGFLLFYLGSFAGLPVEAVKGYKPVATFLGGILPVLGAAVFGIRSTADFLSAKQQSKQMVDELSRLRELMTAERQKLTRLGTDQLFRNLSRSMSDDLKVWGVIYRERELPPAF